jgi:hypothetical protein
VAANRADQARIDPSEQIPEADLLEQQTSVDPPLTDGEYASAGRVDAVTSAELVDEADRWEQQLPVPAAEDEEYPHDARGAGFEAG